MAVEFVCSNGLNILINQPSNDCGFISFLRLSCTYQQLTVRKRKYDDNYWVIL